MTFGANTMVKAGDWVFLQGETRHGKNRTHQHGNRWLVTEIRGDQMLLRSEHKTEGPKDKKVFDGRWVQLKNDANFRWMKIDMTDEELDIALHRMEQMEINTGRF